MRRAPLALGALLCLLVGLAGWRWGRPAAGAPALAASAAAAPASSPAAMPAWLTAPWPGRAPAQGGASAPALRGSPVAAPASVPSGFIEVCGRGLLPRAEFERERAEGEPAPPWDGAFESQSRAALTGLLARLDAGSLRSRVAAAWLREDVDTAARLVRAGGDASAYAMAWAACRHDQTYRWAYAYEAAHPTPPASGLVRPAMVPPREPVPQACAGMSAERWAQLDPADGRPWLATLADAMTRRDAAAAEAALYQFGQRSRLAAQPLLPLVGQALGGEPDAADTQLLFKVQGLQAMAAGRDEFALLRACSAASLADGNHRQLCERAAGVMAGQAGTLADNAVARVLYERLGRPLPAGLMTRAEQDRATSLAMAEVLAIAEDPGCATWRRTGRALLEQAARGELAHLRSRLAAASAASAASAPPP